MVLGVRGLDLDLLAALLLTGPRTAIRARALRVSERGIRTVKETVKERGIRTSPNPLSLNLA